jgi:recombinational DNA repair protein RecR
MSLEKCLLKKLYHEETIDLKLFKVIINKRYEANSCKDCNGYQKEKSCYITEYENKKREENGK